METAQFCEITQRVYRGATDWEKFNKLKLEKFETQIKGQCLRTKCAIGIDKCIGEYEGVIMTEKEAVQFSNSENPYLFEVVGGQDDLGNPTIFVIDASIFGNYSRNSNADIRSLIMHVSDPLAYIIPLSNYFSSTLKLKLIWERSIPKEGLFLQTFI